MLYCKPPFGGPAKVCAYLGRYTHRVAISNHRITDLRDDHASFRYRDYKDHDRQKTMTLPGVGFLRRFLLHVLPHRFVRLRHYGLHAASSVRTKLARARAMLDVRDGTPAPRDETTPPRIEPKPTQSTNAPLPNEPWWETIRRHTGVDVRACPRCKTGRLSRIPLALEPERARAPPHAS